MKRSLKRIATLIASLALACALAVPAGAAMADDGYVAVGESTGDSSPDDFLSGIEWDTRPYPGLHAVNRERSVKASALAKGDVTWKPSYARAEYASKHPQKVEFTGVKCYKAPAEGWPAGWNADNRYGRVNARLSVSKGGKLTLGKGPYAKGAYTLRVYYKVEETEYVHGEKDWLPLTLRVTDDAGDRRPAPKLSLASKSKTVKAAKLAKGKVAWNLGVKRSKAASKYPQEVELVSVAFAKCPQKGWKGKLAKMSPSELKRALWQRVKRSGGKLVLAKGQWARGTYKMKVLVRARSTSKVRGEERTFAVTLKVK